MLDTFYATTAQICFALLGLWWVVVQFKHQEFVSSPSRRRMAYNISLYFVLPGLMSLVALLSVDVKILWRIGFVVAGLIGALETLLMVTTGESSRPGRIGRWVALALYFSIVVFAFSPDLPSTLKLPLTSLEVEGILLALILLLGVNFAWTMFAEAQNPTSTLT